MVTKRQLGLLLLLGGLAIAALAFGVDLIRSGQWQGFGPYQKVGLTAGVLVALLGLSLIPLGGRPA